ncbi:MAG: hypothetical protein RL660_1081 [Bacteroidota bacterium]|jgi:thiol-disulfide isomerase/thioredoxin
MKKIKLIIAASFLAFCAQAQVADGTTVPDFTFQDINGNNVNLYSMLNQGKYVVIDASATWCGPCWSFHTSKVLESLYTAHDAPGDNTARILFLEADVQTTLSDLQGTGTNTVGNWVAGTPYPIMNPGSSPKPGETSFSSFMQAYQVPWYPAFYVICPNKKAWADTLNDYVNNAIWPPTKPIFEWVAANKCTFPAGLDEASDDKPLAMAPNPSNGATTLYFQMNKSAEVNMTITSLLGAVIDEVKLGTIQAGDNKYTYKTSHLAAGTYLVNLQVVNGRSFNTKLVVGQ